MKTLSHTLTKLALCATLLSGTSASVHAVPLIFNSPDFAGNEATRAAWLAALGISSGDTFVDFESGYTQGDFFTNLVLPGGLVISDAPDATTPFGIRITGNPTEIGSSNPVGLLTATHNNDFVRFDFSANPVDYIGFLDIDQSGFALNIFTMAPLGSRITFLNDATYNIAIEDTDTTYWTGDSAEFWGVIANDMGPIKFIDLATSGDATWGIDNLEYGWLNVGSNLSQLTTTDEGGGGSGFANVPETTSTAALLLGAGILIAMSTRLRRSRVVA